MGGTPVTTDTHLHVWDLSTGRYRWLHREDDPARRTFTGTDAAAMLADAGFSDAIIVGAEDSWEETLAQLAVAGANPWARGVVGWLPLDGASQTRRALDRLRAIDPRHLFRGVRQVRFADPANHALLLPDTMAGLRVLAENGLVVDVPDAWPRVMPDVIQLARSLPHLTVVLDHLGQPPLGADRDTFDSWRHDVLTLGALPNTVGKVSGLSTCLHGESWSVTAARPAWETALRAFGPDRLMLGSDWPIVLRGAGPVRYMAVIDELLDELGDAERAAIRSETAERTYLDGWRAPDR